MDVVGSRVTMAAAHSSASARSLTLLRQPSPQALPPLRDRGDSLSVSAEAQARASAVAVVGTGAGFAAAEASARASAEVESGDGVSLSSEEVALLRELIWLLTGRELRVFDGAELHRPGHAAERPPDALPAPRREAPRGDEVRFTATETVSEAEATAFAASGEIITADGQRIAFSVSLAMSRSYSTTRTFTADASGKPVDPLVLNFGGTAAELRDLRFGFDLDSDGDAEQIAQLGAGAAYLVLDRNGNGKVDNGRELFGPASGDGFTELARLDADRDGWVDAADPRFVDLRLWSPDAQGGGSLRTLADAGVVAVGLDRLATPFALRGSGNADLGRIASTGLYVGADAQVGTVQQIDLTV